MSTRIPRSAADIVLALAESDPSDGDRDLTLVRCHHCREALPGDPRNLADHAATCRWLAANMWKGNRK